MLTLPPSLNCKLLSVVTVPAGVINSFVGRYDVALGHILSDTVSDVPDVTNGDASWMSGITLMSDGVCFTNSFCFFFIADTSLRSALISDKIKLFSS